MEAQGDYGYLKSNRGTYTYLRGQDINGWDINCGFKNQHGEMMGYCPVKPYVSNWLDACSGYSGCQAVVVGPNAVGELTGWLRRRPGPTVPRSNCDVFVQREDKR
ncbi:hypothetical protein OEZ85_010512 [Tetradesmus obliquus]|uniref:Uncharacterized protein n=1 Tax=Tetradesmus obliquus TaxID=3088 RepID=A0ABY8TMT3_TETOB|nr:hypothetical protein OEZ85_010512 [Tetradesmus obliquus]